MITLSINQLTVQLTIVQRNVNYQTMILPVSYKSSSIICTANDTISSAFPFEQHANPLTVYLPMIALSINQLTVQLTIVQRNVNYQTMILQVYDKSSSIISTANDRISSAFPFKQHANPLTIYRRMIALSINQLTVQLTIVQRNVNYQTMILPVSYKSSSIICTANDTISSAFPFEQHANPLTVYLRMIALSINQLTVQLTIVQRNVNYQTMILPVSYKSSSIICTANDTISSAFPFEQHANPLTVYLRMIALSINQLTVQLTIVQRNVNYQTMILPVSYKSSSIICTANDTISSAFPFEHHANPLTVYLRMIALSINQLTVQLTIVQRIVNYQTMILLVSYKSSIIICTANDTISSEFPFEQHANPLTVYLRMIALSINQLTVQLTIVQRNVNYQTMILLVSYKSSSIICTANDTISSDFPFEQHANPLTIYLRMITLSINQLTVQLTIVQRNVNYQTMILPVSYKSSSIICTANDTISSAFPFEQHANPLTVFLRMIALSINQLTVQLTIDQTNINYQTMILPISYKSSSIICTANDTISSDFPFEQHANPLTIYLRMITLSINQLTVQLTIVQRNVNYQTMILPVSYKSSSIICTANDTISSAFPFEQHANPLTVFLRMIALSINQLTVQLTIDQTNINYQTMILPISYKSSSIICTANDTISSEFPFEQHANPLII